MLTGRLPFSGSQAEMFRRLQNEKPLPPSVLRPTIDHRLDAICMKAMAKAPRDRYASMEEMAADLDRIAAPPAPPVKTPPPVKDPAPPPEVKGAGRLVPAVAAILFLIAASGVGWYVYPRGKAATGQGSDRKREPTAPVAIEMLTLTPANFLMGSPEGQGLPDEHTAHRVTLTRPLMIGRYEVTHEEYAAVMGSHPSRNPKPKGPVENVSWLDAVTFCNALSERNGLKPFYHIDGKEVTVPDWSADGFRLPTEAEWEYACAGRNSGKFGFGNDENAVPDHAWCSENADGAAHPVGTKAANDWGLHDMQGNVAEWCWDRYADRYPPDEATDPKGPDSGRLRVLRGGDADTDARQLRYARRNAAPPEDAANEFRGFRVARNGRP
jgi:formylglycine-generating enzyme required for sulfatase activity